MMRKTRKFTIGAMLIATIAIGALTRDQWIPRLQRLLPGAAGRDDLAEATAVDAVPVGSHPSSIKLSPTALKNIGFEPLVVAAAPYERRLKLPAVVVERPGRSQVHITAPLTGVVTKIHTVPGEAVDPGQRLFELRLTHEELVVAQRELLRTAENLDVVNREIDRLNALGEGVVAGRRILEQEYEKQKLEASLRAERQAMLLHGISEDQVRGILETRKLFRDVAVEAPEHVHDSGSCAQEHPFQLQRLMVAQGEQVDAGRELAVLADHCELHVEGRAFEDDAPRIREASRLCREVAATLMTGDAKGAPVGNLELCYVADQIDPESRAFKFYLRLPNELALDRVTTAGRRSVEWAYKPGQRMQVSIPIETLESQIVLPSTAVVDDGAETYVYRQNGHYFDQVGVHVIHRDRDQAVVANDGALFPGDVIAGDGAYQMHLALKNQSAGGIDPHAGHTH